MPPKKKLTKEEKEALRIAREEEARRLEEERLAAEEAERQRRAEEDARLAAEEAARLQAENELFEQQAAELQPILDMQEAAVLREMATELIREDWGRLLLCRPTPDPRILKDVNGFVNVHSASSPDTFDDALATFRMYESVASEAAELGNRALDEDMRRSAVLTRIKELHRGGSLDAEQTAALEAFVHEGDLWHALQGLKDSGGLDAPSAQLLSEGCSTQSLAAVGSRMRSLCRALLDAATAVFLAEGQNSAYGESQLMKLGLWRSQKDARLQRAELGHGFVLEVPRPVAMSALAIRLVHQAREEPVNPADAFIAVGGVVSIEVLALPPAPKTIRNWIVQVTPGPLQPLQYSVSAGNMSVTYGLPDGLLRPEGDPIFGWLDPQEKRWVPLEAPGKLDGRQATFFASKTGQFALLYPRTRCLPYRAWRLEANVPEGGATLTLYPIGMEWQEASIEIVLEGSMASLKSPHLPGGGFSRLRPSTLLRDLSLAGVHLLPHDADADAAGTSLKDRDVEDAMARDVALLVSACGCTFESCAYNRAAPGRFTLAYVTGADGARQCLVRSGHGAAIVELPVATESSVETIYPKVPGAGRQESMIGEDAAAAAGAGAEGAQPGEAAQGEEEAAQGEEEAQRPAADAAGDAAAAEAAAAGAEGQPAAAEGEAPLADGAEPPPQAEASAASAAASAHAVEAEPPAPTGPPPPPIQRLAAAPGLPQPLADQLWVDVNVELRRAGGEVLPQQFSALHAVGAKEMADPQGSAGSALLNRSLRELLLLLRLPSLS